MTRRILDQIHMSAAYRHWKAAEARGETGDLATRAIDATRPEALKAYRALPWWQRFGL